ncbi:MAG: TolC family protein [Kofleriaceae bacterium]|nr:TolC family protein [Kofleriaceae bacterium]
MRSPLLCLALCLPAVAAADPPKLTLEQVTALALAGPKARMAEGDTGAAEARLGEANASRLPRFKGSAFGTISPKITCENPECTVTGPQNFAWSFEGVFGSAQIEITQPLYTFGKISHARKAARAGLDAQKALADETAGDLAVDAARAYWGIKVAREMGYMLDDGIDEIAKALERMASQPEMTIQDRQRIAVLLSEAKVQRAEAKMNEQQALAGLRALVNQQDADIDDSELAALERPLPPVLDPARRPQALAARAGAIAASELVGFQKAYYFPDLALVGSAWIARAQGADDPPNIYANDPFNREGVGLVLGLQWNVEPWTVKARHERAKAEAAKASAQAQLAAIGATYDAQNALAEASASLAKVTAAAEGEKSGRAWLASVLQAEAIGAAESRDLADAYLAWFTIRARWAQAVFQWNVAVVRLDRATGEFHARGNRPKEK